MSLFESPMQDVVTSYAVAEAEEDEEEEGVRAIGRRRLRGRELCVVSEGDGNIDLGRQFIAFQMSNQIEGPTILEAASVDPNITGSHDEPDVLVALEMLSFHVGESEKIGEDTRATMRINIGKDESSTDKTFDTVFWSIAAGLKLYDSHKNGRSESKDLKGDFRKAFGNRPIEIPGGLARLSFQVVKHKEPPWWKTMLGFGQSEGAKQLISVLGFPAITTQAIGVIDELLERVSDSEPEVLFSSRPMRLALSKWARDEFTGGNPRIRMGSLKQGFCVLARGQDYQAIAESNALYYPHYGKLAPGDLSESDLISGRYDDPMKDITYGVFRMGMRSAKLDPTFNFQS